MKFVDQEFDYILKSVKQRVNIKLCDQKSLQQRDAVLNLTFRVIVVQKFASRA